MTNTIWVNAVSDDWTNATDWTRGVPTPSRDAIINANGTYTVTVYSADKARSLTLDAAGATLLENSGGSLTMAAGLTLGAGTAALNGANSFGADTRLIGGALELGNAAALGTSNLIIDGGALIGAANIAISNAIDASGTFTLAAAHGDTVRLEGQTILDMNGGGAIEFGQTGDDGRLVWYPVTLALANGGGGFSVDVNAGTLLDGNGSLNEVLSAATDVTVAAGARINTNGYSESIANLSGDGVIASGVGDGTLTVGDGAFSGDIRRALALTVGHELSLTGVNTYSGGTTIDSGAALNLAGNGSIHGNVVDDGVLDINRTSSTAVALDTISGTGSIQLENGTVILNTANTYSGGTTLSGGTLEIGNSAALGTGTLTLLLSSSLIGITTETLSPKAAIGIHGDPHFEAAHGTTLTLDTSGWTIDPYDSIFYFGGYAGDDGVVVWDSSASSAVATFAIESGTLRAGDSNFQNLLNTTYNDPMGTIILGTLDVAGFASTIYLAYGDGTIENSGHYTTVTIAGGDFTGSIVGPITLNIGRSTILGGNAANWSTINVLSTCDLTLDGPSSANVIASYDNNLVLEDPGHFTGSISGLQQYVTIEFDGISDNNIHIFYNGDTTGGTLRVSNPQQGVSFSIKLVGNYTASEFSLASGDSTKSIIKFTPSASAMASATHTDSFDFSTTVAPHVVTDAAIAHGGHAANETAHDVTEAIHAHGLMFDHFTPDLFTYGHAFPEALA
jgi:fibronectin-binding autotransporter adhesin